MRMTVQNLLGGRDNNFNLIRCAAAVAVIYDHSYLVLLGETRGWVLPFVEAGDLGWYAVNVFFILSGFLITKSWLSRESTISFCVGRSLRLFPGLAAAAILLAFIVGPIVCLCLLEHYFSDMRTWLYVPLTASLLSPAQTLPFVFDALPRESIVNNPLWTLRYEALSYGALGLIGLVGLLSSRTRAVATTLAFVGIYVIVTTATDWRNHSPFIDSLMRFWLCFFLGSMVYLVADRIVLKPTIAMFLFGIAVLAYGSSVYEFMLQIALTYGVFWVALVPDGAIRRFNEIGDYSYGLYIYAWPIQQIAVMIAPEVSPLTLFAAIAPTIVLAAMASWHWVERPALGARGAVTAWISTIGGGRLLAADQRAASRR